MVIDLDLGWVRNVPDDVTVVLHPFAEEGFSVRFECTGKDDKKFDINVVVSETPSRIPASAPFMAALKTILRTRLYHEYPNWANINCSISHTVLNGTKWTDEQIMFNSKDEEIFMLPNF